MTIYEIKKLTTTKAFKRNITDDFICGLSSDIIFKYNLGEEPDNLLNNQLALIEYTKEMLQMWESMLLDTYEPILHYPKIKCYKAFLKNNVG